MTMQTTQGKAFEFACLAALRTALETQQPVVLMQTSALATACKFYTTLDADLRGNLDKAASAAVRMLLRLEPQLAHSIQNVPLFLSIQEDAQGIAGDVRDVLCIRKQNEWEIGLSCKHNHSAVKHSRLSYTIDFGALWFGKACSSAYFKEIEPLFNSLSALKLQKKCWSDIANKEATVYMPLLDAFIAELRRLDAQHPNQIPQALLRYLLGRNDFYKVITHDAQKTTQLQAYNIGGTLNRPAGGTKAEAKIVPLRLPSEFYDIRYKANSKNTIVVTCDEGWALSFRIHNASSRVEASLKFDIQLVGVPQSLYSQTEPW